MTTDANSAAILGLISAFFIRGITGEGGYAAALKNRIIRQ
jgi:hypothetical protein